MIVLGLSNRFAPSYVKYWIVTFRIHVSKGPVIIMNQLKSLCNSPFKNSFLHSFPMIDSNDMTLDGKKGYQWQFVYVVKRDSRHLKELTLKVLRQCRKLQCDKVVIIQVGHG